MEKPPSLWLLAGNPDLRTRWRRWLSANGWTVNDVSPRGELAGIAGREGPALLDASLVKDSDLAGLRRRGADRTPVILFGQGESASEDRVIHWLLAGADDFIPASIQEKVLLAKLEAHVRRIMPGRPAEARVLWSPRRQIRADKKTRLVWTKDSAGRWLASPSFTETEHALLCLFLSRPEEPLERGSILDSVWGDRADEIYSETLTKHIEAVRKKLGARGGGLRTVYGCGYMLLEER